MRTSDVSSDWCSSGLASLAHRFGVLRRDSIKIDTLSFEHSQAPVRGDVGYSCESHVLLGQNGRGHPLADDAVTVDRDSNWIDIYHLRPALSVSRVDRTSTRLNSSH